MNISVNDPTMTEDEINKNIGLNISRQRVAKGLSRRDLGERLSITGEAIRRYENGTNHATAVMLLAISRALEAPIEAFFTPGTPIFNNRMEQQRILALVQHFSEISSPRLQEAISSLIKTSAEELKSLESSND